MLCNVRGYFLSASQSASLTVLKVDWDKATWLVDWWWPGPIKVISPVIDGHWYTTVYSLQSTLLPAARLVFYQVCSTPVFILYTLYLAKFTLMLKIQTWRCWYYINMLTCLLQLNSVGKYQDNKKFVGGRVNLRDWLNGRHLLPPQSRIRPTLFPLQPHN